MTTYRIKSTAPWIWIITMMITILGGLLLAIEFLPKERPDGIVVVIFLWSLTFLLQKFTSTSFAEVTLTDDDISICWKSRHIFHRAPNRTIPFADIDSYDYRPDQNFSIFTLKMKDGSEVELSNFSLSRDDFNKFIIDFSKSQKVIMSK